MRIIYVSFTLNLKNIAYQNCYTVEAPWRLFTAILSSVFDTLYDIQSSYTRYQDNGYATLPI